MTLEGLFDEFPGLVEWDRPQGGCVAFPRYLGPDGAEAFCRSLLEERGVLLLPSSIYASDLTPVPTDFFHIGFGRARGFEDGLAAMRAHFQVYYSAFAA